MVNKKFRLGIIVITLVFGLSLTGCDFMLPGDTYTLEFKVQNAGGMPTISKIEFINGSNESDPIIETKEVNLSNGQISNAYKVSGFTKQAKEWKEENQIHYFGVRVSYDSGGSDFRSSTAKDKSKILVSLQGPFFLFTFSEGKW